MKEGKVRGVVLVLILGLDFVLFLGYYLTQHRGFFKREVPFSHHFSAVSFTNNTSQKLKLERENFSKLVSEKDFEIIHCAQKIHPQHILIIAEPTYKNLNVRFNGKEGVFAAYRKTFVNGTLKIEVYGKNTQDMNFALIAAYFQLRTGKRDSGDAAYFYRRFFLEHPIIKLVGKLY